MNHHSIALGWTLLHFVWQASAIAALYGAVEFFSINAHRRYLLGITAQLGMAVGAMFTFVYEERFSVSRQADHLSSTFSTQSRYLAMPGYLGIARVLPWLDVLWLLGVMILSFRTLGGCWFLHCLARSSQSILAEQTKQRLSRIARRLRVQRNVELRLLPGMFSPFTVGLIRSFVYLPLSIATLLSPEQLDSVLAHELAHIRRADYLWNLLQTAVETFFFFHPAVWWLGNKVREQRELCCDEIAVSFTAQPWTYAAALLALEEQYGAPAHLHMALNGNDTRSGLLSRVAHILGCSDALTVRPKVIPVGLCLLLAFGTCTALVSMTTPHEMFALHSLTAPTSPNLSMLTLSSRLQAIPTLQTGYQRKGQTDPQERSLHSPMRLDRLHAIGALKPSLSFAPQQRAMLSRRSP